MFEHNIQIRVYYADTDAQGIVYHANYLRFFEQARTESLRALGIKLSTLVEDYGVQFVVVQITVKFHKPARLDDQLLIISRISHIGRASIQYQQEIYFSDQNKELLCSAEVRLVTVDSQMRPQAVPDVLKKGEPMTTDMSLLSLFTNASLLVQFVMLILLAASIYSWTIIFQRGQFFRSCRASADHFEHNFWSGIDLTKLYNKLSGQQKKVSGLDAIFVAGFREFVRLKKQNLQNPAQYVENVQRAMRISVANEEARLERNLPFLATIQSMSPYIGLFGTVWGIMNSFRQLGAVQQATLSMVAPGISEALIATAMGLIAAIPAGIAYNRYITQVDGMSLKYRMFMEEFVAIMQRRVSGVYEDHNDA